VGSQSPRSSEARPLTASSGDVRPHRDKVARETPGTEPHRGPAYDVTPLLEPTRKYLGVTIDGAPHSMRGLRTFARQVSSKPNIITIYESFDDDFAAAEVRRTHRYGALPIVRWEPFDARLADIARGRYDRYISSFAAAVRRVNAPIALTFAHEMNGYWYPWGTNGNRATDFVSAWRRIHRLFAEVDARNVIWVWTPNVISATGPVDLARLYPGDPYVDWVGLDGYFTHGGPVTYAGLFGSTMREVEQFTGRPFLIVETGVEPGPLRNVALRNLIRGVARDRRMLGFVYFNQEGSGQWGLDGDRSALGVYATTSKRLPYGFVVR
jgi:mannan endo-1,4-beta-mannosidase